MPLRRWSGSLGQGLWGCVHWPGVLEETSFNFIFILRGSRVGGDLVWSNREWCLITVWKWISAAVDGGAASHLCGTRLEVGREPTLLSSCLRYLGLKIPGLWIIKSHAHELRFVDFGSVERHLSCFQLLWVMLLWTNVCFQMTDASDCHKEKPDSGSAYLYAI